MTDEPDATDPHADGLPPEQEAEVRRLLTDAGGPVPTPPEVVSRLDATLARLVEERAAEQAADRGQGPVEEEHPAATVTPLGVRRRRWPRLLLAAAAVVVGGYGLGAAVTGSMSGQGSDSSAGGGEAADSAQGGSASSDGAEGFAREPNKGTLDTSEAVPRLSSDDFATGVTRLVEASASADALQNQTDDGASAGPAEPQAARKARGRCAAPPSHKRDTWFVVRYDGRPATLVVGPPQDGRVRAQVFSCDGTTLLRDSTVDLP